MSPEKIEDGGPAFPHGIERIYVDTYGGTEERAEAGFSDGMSRRDWISGQALVGLLASGQWHNNTVQAGFAENIVMHADEIADAWLAARTRKLEAE